MGFRGNDNMPLRLLSVISVTALAALASTAVNAQRGLTAGPSGDRSSPPADLVLAQKDTSLEPGETFRDCGDCLRQWNHPLGTDPLRCSNGPGPV